MLTQAHVSLEIPIDKRDAARRGLRAGAALAKLLVSTTDDKELSRLLSYVLSQWRPPQAEILICAENPFSSLSRALGKGQDHLFIYEKLDAARGTCIDVAVSLIAHWPAEAHVVFFGDEKTLKSVVAVAHQPPGLSSAGLSTSFQGCYLNSLDITDPFVFLAHGHPSLEVIGSAHAVLRAFDSIRSLFAPEDRSIIL